MGWLNGFSNVLLTRHIDIPFGSAKSASIDRNKRQTNYSIQEIYIDLINILKSVAEFRNAKNDNPSHEPTKVLNKVDKLAIYTLLCQNDILSE